MRRVEDFELFAPRRYPLGPGGNEGGGVMSAADGDDPGSQRRTDSGINVDPVYTDADLEGFDPAAALGAPGEPPYTRGVYSTMYRSRPWTMRQYSGFGTAKQTNERFHYLL